MMGGSSSSRATAEAFGHPDLAEDNSSRHYHCSPVRKVQSRSYPHHPLYFAMGRDKPSQPKPTKEGDVKPIITAEKGKKEPKKNQKLRR
ncbi:Hypothetical protein NocV09_00701760 [Nannochloropsis oceanica]